jgi:hypothetical protein
MVWFDGAFADFAPQPPNASFESIIASQAGGSAGPLPADPLFFCVFALPFQALNP